jgi:hypothetical protein
VASVAGAEPAPAGAGDWTVIVPGPGSVAGRATALYAVTAGAPLGRCLVVTQEGGQTALSVIDPLRMPDPPAPVGRIAHPTTPDGADRPVGPGDGPFGGPGFVRPVGPGDGPFGGPGFVRPVEGIDPSLGLLRFEAGASDQAEVLARGNVVTGAWEQAVAAGRRALASELCGLSRAMLALAVDHAGQRRQFGQPIGQFQAVKHRLADARVALTAAEAAVAEAWADPRPLTALLAKLWAGRAARMGAKQAQQVLGGMGFTWEHPFHRHLRRALVLDALLGSTTELQHELGRSLLATGDVPDLAHL